MRPAIALVLVALCLWMSSGATLAAQAAGARVLVTDQSGAPVAGARVSVGGAETVTGPDGIATVADAATGTAVTVRADGFGTSTATLGGSDALTRVVLAPAGFKDAVTVTAARGHAQLETPAATSVVTSAAVLTSAAGAVDDLLRYTPGFSLFRRSSSRVANPTTQGVTLRGVSGSGASRTLVLADGIPLNDPFGSWVYWNRIPQAAIDRVEVLRGAAADLYGAEALGGVIQVLSFEPTRTQLRAFVDGGSYGTARGSLYGGGVRGGWNLFASGEAVGTDGVVTVAEEDRGPVDVEAGSDYRTGTLSAGWQEGGWRAGVRASAYREERENGTPLQVNDTTWRQYAGNVGGLLAGGIWQASVAGGSQSYYQTFTAVAANRETERLTTEQTTPSDWWLTSGTWARDIGAHSFLAGAEYHDTSAQVDEIRYSLTGVPSGPFVVGGDERLASGFARVRFALGGSWTLGAGARVDSWKSTPIDPTLPTQSQSFFSPRLSLGWQGDGAWGVHVAAYRSYRTPTLNELHRGFRAGNVVTNPNPLLEPERLTGAEGGVLYTAPRWSARATTFYNVLDGAIANITLSSTPTQITRQRQNSDEIRAVGAEVEGEFRLSSTLTLNGQLTLTNSEFRGSVATPAIAGNDVPQVPGWGVATGLTWADPRLLTINAQLRASDDAYDDDLNTLVLGRYAVVDLFFGRSLVRQLNVFLAVENLFDEEYDTARTPVRSIGWPRTLRTGVRVFLP
jgi:outer membrane receptor protein involved in Fe transport